MLQRLTYEQGSRPINAASHSIVRRVCFPSFLALAALRDHHKIMIVTWSKFAKWVPGRTKSREFTQKGGYVKAEPRSYVTPSYSVMVDCIVEWD